MYSTMSVSQLKQELKKRNASVTGKKTTLIDRLEAYDRNSMFGVEDELDDDVLAIPPPECFRDVNASCNLPSLSKHHIQAFIDRFQTQPKGRILYESRHLMTARAAFQGNFTYIQAQCKAQMKKLLYIVNIKLDTNGSIEESHCECAAGSGLEAHCKHVFVVLYGIEDMVRTKTIILHKVCTQELMAFKRPRKVFYDSPLKAQDMPTKSKRQKCVNYFPLEDKDIMENYADYVRNLTIGFGTSTMPFRQTIRPANPYGVEWDHAYTSQDPKETLLQELLLKNVSHQVIKEIEECTRAQDSCNEWHRFRSHRATASNFHAICHSKPATQRHLAENILYPKKFYSRATAHGKVQEFVALKQYEEKLGLEVTRCGLFISSTHPFLAASPDGLIQDETVVEVKCPYVARYNVISPVTVPYLYECDGEIKLKMKHNYYTQIQGQLFCSNRKYCNLVIFTFVDMKIIYVERDEPFISEMLVKLTSFYQEHLEKVIFNKYLYKNYDNIIKIKQN